MFIRCATPSKPALQVQSVPKVFVTVLKLIHWEAIASPSTIRFISNFEQPPQPTYEQEKHFLKSHRVAAAAIALFYRPVSCFFVGLC